VWYYRNTSCTAWWNHANTLPSRRRPRENGLSPLTRHSERHSQRYGHVRFSSAAVIRIPNSRPYRRVENSERDVRHFHMFNRFSDYFIRATVSVSDISKYVLYVFDKGEGRARRNYCLKPIVRSNVVTRRNYIGICVVGRFLLYDYIKNKKKTKISLHLR